MSCIRGCSPPSEEEIRNVRKWGENMENMLYHQQGHERFRRYLNQRDLMEHLSSLEFWDMCCELENKLKKHSNNGLSQTEVRELEDEIDIMSFSLVRFAEDFVNFDKNQMIELSKIENDAVHNGHILMRAKASARSLLEEEWNNFIEYLNKFL